MTTGDYPPPPPDPNFPPPPPGGYPPPPPGYGPPTGYPVPQYGQAGGYPPPPQYGAGNPGGLGIRFAARVIDGILVGIIAFLLAFVVGLQSNIMVTGLFSGLLMFVYFVALEVTQGASLGKKILGLSVRGAGGAPKPDVKQSAIRNSFTLLPIIPYIGGLLAFIAYVVIAITINGSPTKQGKHDELAGGTQVVKS
ncbi:MAG: RDD family protein [Mycobacterium sp.]|nr:RDD family protein [Mycobacterium sp.]